MQDGAGEEGGIQLLLKLKILADGEEQARQLGELADDPRARAEHYRGAARLLQCTLGKAAAVAKAAVETASGSSRCTDRSDSPRSADESSGGTPAVEAAQERQYLGKRRKGLPRWTAKFRVPDANLEATPDDGFSWRKYGQKDILGARFPRGYYRCTYRTAQGCPATKQVQRSDADLCVFDVTYQGEHTCHQKPRQVAAHGGTQSPPPPPPSSHHEQQDDPSCMQLLMGFKDALKVETATPLLHHDRDYYDPGPASAPAAPFSFPSVMPFHHHAAGEATDNPAAAAGSSYFSAPPPPHHCPAEAVAGSCYDVFDYEAAAAAAPGARVRGAAESSELGEVVSRATGCDYASLYHQAELDPHLPFAPFGGPSHGPYQ